jgi:nitrate reductase assembly molybdenum cofactor insertion protein NarJ
MLLDEKHGREALFEFARHQELYLARQARSSCRARGRCSFEVSQDHRQRG